MVVLSHCLQVSHREPLAHPPGPSAPPLHPSGSQQWWQPWLWGPAGSPHLDLCPPAPGKDPGPTQPGQGQQLCTNPLQAQICVFSAFPCPALAQEPASSLSPTLSTPGISICACGTPSAPVPSCPLPCCHSQPVTGTPNSPRQPPALGDSVLPRPFPQHPAQLGEWGHSQSPVTGMGWHRAGTECPGWQLGGSGGGTGDGTGGWHL